MPRQIRELLTILEFSKNLCDKQDSLKTRIAGQIAWCALFNYCMKHKNAKIHKSESVRQYFQAKIFDVNLRSIKDIVGVEYDPRLPYKLLELHKNFYEQSLYYGGIVERITQLHSFFDSYLRIK